MIIIITKSKENKEKKDYVPLYSPHTTRSNGLIQSKTKIKTEN